MEWQPIETFPGTDCQDAVLLTTEGVELAWWASGPECWLTPAGKYIYGEPTHWMPLPEPPEA